MTQETGERSLKRSILWRGLFAVGIGAAMLVCGFLAFLAVYHGPPTSRITASTIAAVGANGTQPATQGVAEVPANPPMMYQALVVGPGGKPAANVPYRVYHPSMMSPTIPVEAEGRTGSDGVFSVGPYRREGDAGPNRVVMLDAPGYGWAWWNVRTGSAFLLHNQTRIALQPAVPVAGIVTNAGGEPVADAVVEAEAQTLDANTYGDAQFTEQNDHSVRTDAHGAFRFDRIPDGTLLQLHVRHAGYASYSTRAVSSNHFYPISAGMADVAIQLQPEAVVRGQLTVVGKPLARAGVWIEAFDRSHVQFPTWAESDANGVFDVRGLSEGRWDFLAPNMTTPDGTLAVRRTNVQVKAGENRKLNIVCEAGEIVHGTLKDPQTHRELHEAMQVNVVTALPGSIHTQSDGAGRFAMRLPIGRARFAVRGWDNGRAIDVEQDVDVTGGMPDVELNVHPRPILRGQLVDENGNAKPGQIVIGNESVVTQPDGRFAIAAPEIERPGFAGVASSVDHMLGCGFSYTPTDESQPLQLFLQPMAAFTGQFVDDKGKPVADDVQVRFDIRLARGGVSVAKSIWDTTIDQDGRFRIAPIPPGFRLQLVTQHGNEQRVRRIQYYDQGQTLDLGRVSVCSDVGVPHPRDAVLSGTLVDETGKPVIGLEVGTLMGGVPTTATDIKGRFKMTHLPRDQQVSLNAALGGYGTCDWSATAGKQDVQLTMTPLGAELRDKPAPDLVVAKWINPGSAKIADYGGKVVLLQTGTGVQWSPPGQSDATRAFEKYKDKGFVLITINQAWGINRVQEIETWVKQNKVAWPCAIDATDDRTPAGVERRSEGATAAVYASHHTSNLSYLIDKKGIVRACPSGKDRDLDQWIQKLLAE